MQKLKELLSGNGGNYILPFLWMHGEEQAVIGEEIQRIYDCGIREFCLESRPYPHFCQEPWWRDVAFVLEKAKSMGMRVWILDDDEFPTGHANGGYVKQPQRAKRYLAQRHMDIIGPAQQTAVLIDPFWAQGEDTLLAVLAYPKPDTETFAISGDGVIDCTGSVHQGFVYLDLPPGRYRLFVLFSTQRFGGRKDYINLIDEDSVQVLLDEVYEPHYRHFADYFGSTLAGFFSDEPELGNTPGYDFHETLGKPDVMLPWSGALETALRRRWGSAFAQNLPYLWFEGSQAAGAIRFAYMDEMTKLVQRCFSEKLGGWCAAHRVEYIGHIIEDDNAHARLGCSIGHYFREQRGQHRSGIDVVHHEIMPGFDEKIHQWIAGTADGEFFHYGLAKLGSSSAHLDANKNGRALCEIFGNYGWAEGVSLMQWLTNHMLVRGINCFVPHAFSPKFPDRDCPPHFYARGNNPQYPHFGALMRYMNRLCHLLSGGTHQAQALVLYHGEAEWYEEQTMLLQKPLRTLMEHQLDADVIDSDTLAAVEDFPGGCIAIGNERFHCLIIPACKAITPQVHAFCLRAAAQGVPIFCVNHLPQCDTEGKPLNAAFAHAAKAIPMAKLAETVAAIAPPPMQLEQACPKLRFYAYAHADGEVWMFFNESINTKINTLVHLRKPVGTVTAYQAMTNTAEAFAPDKQSFTLSLEPGCAAVYLLEHKLSTAAPQSTVIKSQPLSLSWTVSSRRAGVPGSAFEPAGVIQNDQWRNMNGPEGDNSFSGTFRYEGEFSVETLPSNACRLRLPCIGDAAQVWINGHNAGFLLHNNAVAAIGAYLVPGQNRITIDVTNTLVWQLRDGVSTHMQVYPTGLQAAPVLEWL